MALSSVDFPDPLEPINAVTTPAGIVNEDRWSAVTGP